MQLPPAHTRAYIHDTAPMHIPTYKYMFMHTLMCTIAMPLLPQC